MSEATASVGEAHTTRIARVLRWSVGLVILGFGLFTFDRDSPFWATVSLLLYALPLAFQFTAWVNVRVYALWFGAFLVIQSAVWPLVDNDFVTLPPNLRSTVDVRVQDGHGMRPGLRQVTTDAKGFRVRPAVDYEKKAGTRIFAIGGSTTEDIMLGDDATWANLLQQALKARGFLVEVINTGVSGLRARNHLATINAVSALQPDMLIVLVGGNDWNRHIRDHFEPSRERYRPLEFRLSPLGQMLSRFVVTPLRTLITGKSGINRDVVIETADALNGDKSKRSLQRAKRHQFRPAEVTESYRAEMLELSKTCQRLVLRCLFVTQPHAYDEAAPEDLRKNFWMTPPYADYTLDLGSMRHIAALYNGFLIDLAKRGGHGLCDVAAHMPPSVLMFYDDMHFTDEGARRVAELMMPCVEKLLSR